MPLGNDGGIDSHATKKLPGQFKPNSNAFGASCLLHCVQFTRAANCRPYETNKIRLCNYTKKEHPVGALLFYTIILIRPCHR